MKERFSQEDLGKLVSLTVDVRNHDELCYQRDEEGILRIAYEAIIGYEFLIRTKQQGDRIRVRGKILDQIDMIKISKHLGASSITSLGEIVEVGEDYVKLKTVKRRRNYIY